jgi:hypothetical protein
MTMSEMLHTMPASEMTLRLALDRIKHGEREKAQRMAKAGRR